MANQKRKDYLRNGRSRHPQGCMWCGAEVAPPVTHASYCSDGCVQADYEGIDDIPPIVPCADPAGMSEEAKSRAIERMNASYSDWAARRAKPDPSTYGATGDGDATGGGPYTSGSSIEA
jgi:Tfp pilus assembly protein PilV